MVRAKKTVIRVGKTEANPEGLELPGVEYIRSGSGSNSIIFTEGFSGRLQDYLGFLEGLADMHDVYAFNIRGHGGAQGTVDFEACIDDLTQIYDEVDARYTSFIGHSIGAAIASRAAQQRDVDRLVVIAPFIGIDHLPKLQELVVRFAGAVASSAVTKMVDKALDVAGLHRSLLKLHMNYPVQSAAALNNVNVSDYEGATQDTLVMLPTEDGNVHQNTEPARDRYVKTLKDVILQPTIDMLSVEGLNHSLNFTGLSPFLKPELGKNRQKIFDSILSFTQAD